jgi:hypothetical protein
MSIQFVRPEDLHDEAEQCAEKLCVAVVPATDYEALKKELAELKAESKATSLTQDRMKTILDATANALHGGELETGLWSWHDLPLLAKNMREGLGAMISAHRSALQIGFDRITALGGNCDHPSKMIGSDPAIREAMAALDTGCVKCGDWGKVYDEAGELNAPCPNGCRSAMEREASELPG